MCLSRDARARLLSERKRPELSTARGAFVSLPVNIAQIGRAVNDEFLVPWIQKIESMKVQKIPAQIGQIGFVRIEVKGHVTGWATRCPRGDHEVANFNEELNQVAAFMLETFASEIEELELWLEEIREPGVVLLGDAQREWLGELSPGSAHQNERKGVLHRLWKLVTAWRAGYAE